MLQRLSAVVKDVGLEDEEIKWQKVNEYTEERYKKIIDVLFELLGEGERLYKHIRTRIWELHPGFNIGVTHLLRSSQTCGNVLICIGTLYRRTLRKMRS